MHAPVITKAPLVKYVHDALTGKVIASRTVALSNPFNGDWIISAVAVWHECDESELACNDDDEIVRGDEILARVTVN